MSVYMSDGERLLNRLLTSRDHLNDDGEPMTVVDGLFAIADSIDRLTEAIERERAE